uniref:G-protein coupled receptors family 1 profile domain-containing protein n=1 Tax=Scleropages formosus TaxID=113540 RepID=A0A8C9R4G1_SCLFO
HFHNESGGIDTILIFTAYGPPGPLVHMLFTLTFFGSHCHNLRNSFSCITVLHLAKNGVTGSTSTCPVILGLVISVKKEGSSERCLLQVFLISFCASSAYAVLTAMAYDRYVSICKPLYTCKPLLITFVNFSIASPFSVIYNRSSDNLPSQINISMCLHVILIPPLLSPLIWIGTLWLFCTYVKSSNLIVVTCY